MKDRIEQIMIQKGVSKRELAHKLGILPQNVNVTIATENLSKLRQIADAIGCDVSDFLTDKLQNTINGYIEYNGEIYRIKNIDDFNKLAINIAHNKKG